MSDWQPGRSVITLDDEAAWQAWKRSSKLEAQRWRRARYPRIDYYPSPEALSVIQARTFPSVGGDLSSVIDRLVLAGARRLPEYSARK